ncbi:hypothetical protein BM1_02010 [Bipolaris maydis]|nr:hypothetical protein BM1_02010 [Bipolaris maydis]
MMKFCCLEPFPSLLAFLTRIHYHGVGSVAFKNIRNPIDTLIASVPDGRESIYQNKTPVSARMLALMLRQDHQIIVRYQGDATWIEYKETVTITLPVIAPTQSNPSIKYGGSNSLDSEKVFYFDISPLQRDLLYSLWLAPNNITQHVERLETAMTDRVRSINSRQMLLGQASYTEQDILVQWERPTFSLLLLVLKLVFLVAMYYDENCKGYSNRDMEDISYAGADVQFAEGGSEGTESAHCVGWGGPEL